MKIAISSTAENINSNLNSRFGRCEYFIIYDTENEKTTAVENGGRLSPSGAGIATAKMVADLGAEAVITGFVGPKAFAALQAAGIKIYSADHGTVEEVIKQYLDNKLTEVQSANAAGR